MSYFGDIYRKQSNGKFVNCDQCKALPALQSQLDAYKIALKYFTDQSQMNKDIVANLLKENSIG